MSRSFHADAAEGDSLESASWFLSDTSEESNDSDQARKSQRWNHPRTEHHRQDLNASIASNMQRAEHRSPQTNGVIKKEVFVRCFWWEVENATSAETVGEYLCRNAPLVQRAMLH